MKADYTILGAKLRKLAAQFPYLGQALKLVWSAAPRHATLWAALLVLQGLLPIAIVYFTRSLVNAVVAAVRSAADPRRALLLMAVMAALLLLSEAARAAADWVRTAQAELVQDHVSSLIHRKSASVDIAFYDMAEFYDHLHRARSEAGYRPVILLENVGGIVQNGITLISMVAILIPFGAWLPLALLASTLPALYVVLRHALDQHYWRQRTTADERRTWYFDWLLTAGEAAAEIRLFGLGDRFQTAFQALRSRLRSERLQLAKRQAISALVAGLFALLATGAALGWMGWLAMRGRVTLGDLAMFYQAVQQGMRLSRSVLDNVGQLYANTLFLGNLFEFLALEPKIRSAGIPKSGMTMQGGIRFRAVSFRYPGTERPALSGLDLEIAPRRITAIVGTNGAGKSTLVKLLCRLYDPDEGSVELDGADLRSMDPGSLRSSITVLFQQPVHYNATAAENIQLGDVTSASDLAAVEAAAEAAGADDIVSRLPAGYQQLLGRRFENGTELSSGEWQRIALARAFLRQAPIIILDEPTSAMDPWAESDWLRRFRVLAEGRTAVLITHRFTTAMIADTIYVMSEGKVAERGSHEELLAAGGGYARWWGEQVYFAKRRSGLAT
ncbi:MAG TPA: ABC transporter ATP-binding protein [Candidatus Acidoferrales bacterium]|nr:ABC transporter ATP-binding protein [Candidatus Acidoferrales bacterium]